MLPTLNSFSMVARRPAVTMLPRAAAAATVTATAAASPVREAATTRRNYTMGVHSGQRMAAPVRARVPTTTGNGTVPTTFGGKRGIFIQTEVTPNGNALKFLPNHAVIPPELRGVQSLEYLSPRATLAPPYPSPLAARLLDVPGVSAVFFGPDFVTVTKTEDATWPHIKPEVFSVITEAVTQGIPMVTPKQAEGIAAGDEQGVMDSSEAAADEEDEVVGMIKELLDTRIRPAIQEDGGDIEFRGFDPERGAVRLKLRGACRTCDSSTVTLKNGIESMLMHYIEEVQSVEQVMDQEEEIALQEFEKFERKLRQQQESQAQRQEAAP